jgi:uncharacterized membrane protein YhaH (DUF805 family)
MLTQTNPSAATGDGTGSIPEALRAPSPAIARRTDVILLTVFWAYVTVTNIMWGTSMQASLAANGVTHVFAMWDARLVQHLLLFPALVGGMWLSRRTGWQPLRRAIPLQLIIGIGFAALGNPLMDVAEAMLGVHPWHDIRVPGQWVLNDHYPGRQSLLWVASASTFLINYAFGLALLTGFDFYRRYRDGQVRTEALERSLSAAHLTALRMQLSPHTLFNLLHTIRGHVTWDPGAAQTMIVQLGDLLRRALQAGEHELSRLQDEMDFVQLYLQLQQRRFADRLSLSIPDPDSLPSVWVPSLILQPLVENAVVHGLAQPQPRVTVRIEVVVDAETLILRVVNSMPPTSVVTDSEQTGIGLKNVRERLAIQFEGRATCRSSRTPNNEWLAELRLPMLHNGA